MSSEMPIHGALLISRHPKHGAHLPPHSRIKPRLPVMRQPGESDFLGDTFSFSLCGLYMS